MRLHIVGIIAIMIALISAPLLADNSEGNHLMSSSSYSTCLASQNQGLLQSQVINYVEGQQSEGEKYYPKYKSESTAYLLAFIPGFFIHGMGHFYAGDYKTGIILLGLGMLIVPGSLAEIGYTVADNKEDEGGLNAAHVAFGVGLAAFLISWIYDIAHSSVAVEKYNDRVRAQIYYSSNRGDDIQVGLAVRF